MPKEEKGRAHATIHMDKDEYRKFQHDRIDRGFGKISEYLLSVLRLGNALLGEYDWQDALALFRGEDTDRDWIKAEVRTLRKDVSLEEYQRRLLESKEGTKQGKRICELRLEVIDEELDEVEHLLER